LFISLNDWGPKPIARVDDISIPPSQRTLQRLNLLSGLAIHVRGPKPSRSRQGAEASKSSSGEEIVPLQVFLGICFANYER
jgi:hypothetical protein